MNMNINIIEIKDVSFGYINRHDTLKNINLEIEEGKFTCIIGANGSGKSTLIKCVLGLIKGYCGEIKISERVGYLPQRMNIQSDFPASVKEVVLSGAIAKSLNKIFYKKQDKEHATKIMKDLEIYDIRHKSFAELSGGQQQRVLIARALCADSKVLILDEPTNGLDQKISIQIYELLEKLKKDFNCTIIMISHDIDRSLKCADKVVELQEGTIKYNGTPEAYLGGAK